MADVRYAVTVDAAGAVASIQKLDAAWKQVDKTHKDTAQSSTGLTKAMDSLAGQFTVATLAANGIQKVMSGFKNLFDSAITGAIESEQSEHRLATALEMTGRARNGGTKDLLSFARAQMAATTYSDEQVAATMTLLAQLTKLDNEGIKKTTLGIIGLASVLGPNEGLEGATSRVTRAIEGNAAGLSRVGIRIDATLPKGEQLLQIQEKLAGMYPRATAELDTMGGSLKQLKVAWGEILEQVGKNILKDSHAVEVAKDLTKILREMGQTAGDAGDGISYLGLKSDITRQAMKHWTGDVGPLTQAFMDLQAELPSIPINMQAMTDAYIRGKGPFEAYLALVRGAAGITGIIDKFVDEDDPEKVFNLSEAMKELGIKGTAPLTVELKLAERALAAMLATGTEAPGVLEAMRKKIADLEAQLRGATEGFDAMTLRMFNMRNRFPIAPLATAITQKPLEILPEPSGQRQTALQAQFDWLNAEQIKAAQASLEMGRIWEQAMGTMLGSVVAFGDGTGSVFKNVGEIFGNFIKSAISGLEMMVMKEMWSAVMVLKAEKIKSLARHISNIFAKVPFPLDLILVAGAFAVVNALFSKVLKFKEGGVFTKPTIAEVGHGTEYVLPERKLINIVRDAMRMPAYGMAPAMAGGGGSVVVNFNAPLISTVQLSDANIAMAGAKIKAEVLKQMHRLG
ncbi:MAG: hypothetical protein IMZ54_11790 [Acidobacteria bacterium]|nr:hypothetical protein [Acidobacteriota bacterium]